MLAICLYCSAAVLTSQFLAKKAAMSQTVDADPQEHGLFVSSCILFMILIFLPAPVLEREKAYILDPPQNLRPGGERARRISPARSTSSRNS